MQCRSIHHIRPVYSHLKASSVHQWPCTYCHRNRNISTLVNQISNASLQSYVSASNDPYLNLSFEHHLLQRTPADSTVLFLYINRPCVVIGRNQNPWAEVNLHALATALPESAESTEQTPKPIDLVRRRSGGGTVFHDYGNVNWTVISPSSSFTRDKHVEMVVRGLRSCGIDRARVNERHDIVLDTATATAEPGLADKIDVHDTHRTRYTRAKASSSSSVADSVQSEETVKISGSAYKLTRGRALHHGTCLLASPHLAGPGGGLISHLLHAPGAPYIEAKGVASVRSSVANVGIAQSEFIEAVQHAFTRMYNHEARGKKLPTLTIDDSVSAEIPSVHEGMQEMKTRNWMFGQTPQFTLSLDTMKLPESGARLASTLALPPGTRLLLTAKHAVVTDADLVLHEASETGSRIATELKGINLADDDQTWEGLLVDKQKLSTREFRLVEVIASALQKVLPINVRIQ